jgi:hypothetical protein
MSADDDEPYERAAARWLARFVCERPEVELSDLRTALLALEALPYSPAAAKHTLADICARHRLGAVVGMLAATRPRRASASPRWS